MITRWFFGLIICAAFAIGVYYFYDLWTNFQYQQAEVEYLETELRNYEKLERMYEEQEEKVAALQGLWDEIENAGMTPEQWRTYSLSVSRNLNWQQLERLMRLASNDIRGEGEYWFMPNRLRVSRVVEEGARAREGQEGQEGGVTLTAEQGGAETEVQMFYQTNMSGNFLIPKNK